MTLTDDKDYELLKYASQGQKRTIANYIEYAAVSYTLDEMMVSEGEMDEILEFEDEIRKGMEDFEAGRYRVVDDVPDR